MERIGTTSTFNESLEQWVKAICQSYDDQRRLEQSIRSKESSILWYETEILKLRERLVRKPSVIKQIREYHHRVRQLHLEIAFEII
jgi:Rad3-related DNA helicase